MKSEQTNELAAALAKAQSKIIGALKDSQNPFFKSNYADLASVWDAIRIPLTENGLAVTQTIGMMQIEDTLHDTLTTALLHTSGQWVDSTMHLRPVKSDPQALGSCITYARRYALAAITGCPQIDDDGNEASKPSQRPEPVIAKKPMAEKVKEAFPTAKVTGYVCGFGKYKGKDLSKEPNIELLNYVKFLKDSATNQDKPLSKPILEFVAAVESLGGSDKMGNIPF